MNVTDMADQIAAEHSMTKTMAREVVQEIFALVVDAAARGEEVSVPGFGKFKLTSRPAREGRNPATGEKIQIAASRKLSFTAAKSVKDRLNAPPPKKGARKAAPRK
jgi:DNA-binding protein HU-beta